MILNDGKISRKIYTIDIELKTPIASFSSKVNTAAMISNFQPNKTFPPHQIDEFNSEKDVYPTDYNSIPAY